MGIHGLTSWVEQQRIGERVILVPTPRPSYLNKLDPTTEPIPMIIDGLAFLAYVMFESIDPILADGIRGGNHTAIRKELVRLIDYFRSVGLEPEFVWDGPCGLSKVDTIKERTLQKIAAISFYTRGTEYERAQPQRIEDATGAPMLCRNLFLNQLRELGVKMHFATGEADSRTAELAQRKNGYAVSQDSDFFIFPANSRGYIPLQSIRYGQDCSAKLTARHSTEKPRLEFVVHCPSRIAQTLGLPLERLPVFASLCGNDFADYYRYFKFYKPSKWPGGRPWVDHLRVAQTLNSFVSNGLSHEAVLKKALPILTTGMTAFMLSHTMIEQLNISAKAYDLQSIEDVGSNFALSPRRSDTIEQAKCRELYKRALDCGNLLTFTLQAIQFGFIIPVLVLERLDIGPTSVIYGRPLRRMIYSVLTNSGCLENRATIEEFCRQGDFLQASPVSVSTLSSLAGSDFESSNFPIILGSTGERIRFMGSLLHYNGAIPCRSDEAWPFFSLVLALRHIQQHSTTKWTKAALFATLATAVVILSDPSTWSSITETINLPAAPPLRHLQRSAELVQTSFYLHALFEVLLISQDMAPVEKTFDGSTLHRLWLIEDDLIKQLQTIHGLGESRLDLIERVLGMVQN